jgi:hypothetical protein
MPSDLLAAAAQAGQLGMTPREVAAYLRISPDRVRAMIVRGEIGCINTSPSRCGKPRYVILPRHLAEWERTRQVAPPPKTPPRRRRRAGRIDHFPQF